MQSTAASSSEIPESSVERIDREVPLTRPVDGVRTIDLSEGPIVTLTLSRPTDVEGFGLHCSPSRGSDGFGGFSPELYLRAGTRQRPGSNLVFHLFSAPDPDGGAPHAYRVDLGPKQDIHSVSVHIQRENVSVEWSRLSRNRSTDGEQYMLSAFISPAEELGFFAGDPTHLFFRADGVLSGRRGRGGTGYQDAEARVHDGIEPRDSEGGDDTDNSSSGNAGAGGTPPGA